MTEFVELLTNVGFPIAVSIYLLYRDSTMLAELTKSINANTTALTRLLDKMDKDVEIGA